MDSVTQHTIIVTLAPLLIGWVLDLLLGDPSAWPHPVVWFGRAISYLERRLNHGGNLRAKGAVAAIGLTVSVYALTWLLLSLASWLPLALDVALRSVMVFYGLAGTTLVREVRMVFAAADRSLDEGRRQVSRIVGRDTSALTDGEVRTAALETLAENLSDGVVAPLFWYALLGLPGMMAYKMVNTLDSMIAYRTPRYLRFGMVAARLDDVANYLPARLTALLMVIASGHLRLMGFVVSQGPRHASPNSGWPEAALAGALGCRFGGTHDYFGVTVPKPYIGTCPRPLTGADLLKATRIARRAEIMAVILTGAIATLIALA